MGDGELLLWCCLTILLVGLVVDVVLSLEP
jgi:hypothetical protein